MKYKVGTKLECEGIIGTVVDPYKFIGDVCVEWENGLKCSYDVDWLDKHAHIIRDESGALK